MRTRGFTIIEVMIAIFVAAIMFSIGYSAINQALRDRDSINVSQARIYEIQRGVRVVAQDFAQIIARAARDTSGTGQLMPAVMANGSDNIILTFTRAGWSNPAGLPRPAEQRVRYRFAEEGDWPLDMGVYFELAEFHNEIEIEEKLLLSKRFGYLTLVSNLWVEQEYYFQTQEWKLVYNPTLGGVYELSPNLMLGLEYWARGRFNKDSAAAGQASSDSPTAARHYLGPTILLQSGEAWWSTGVYARLDNLGEAAQAEDPYGKVWIRTMVGMGF